MTNSLGDIKLEVHVKQPGVNGLKLRVNVWSLMEVMGSPRASYRVGSRGAYREKLE